MITILFFQNRMEKKSGLFNGSDFRLLYNKLVEKKFNEK